MIGPFWRTRRLWGCYDPRLLEGEKSTNGESLDPQAAVEGR